MNAKKSIKYKLQTIPKELRELPNWHLWRYEAVDGRTTKMPYQPNGKRAKANDPATWCSFMDAARAAAASEDLGVSFQLGNSPYVGIDLDYKEWSEEGIPATAMTIIEGFDSYTEITPSGRGVHIIIKAELKPGYKSRVLLSEGVELEVYATGRAFTMTGDMIQHPFVESKQLELDILCEALLKQPEPDPPFKASPGHSNDLSVSQIVDRALASNDQTFISLYHGDLSAYGNDHSRADAAFIMKALFWANGDQYIADQLYRLSCLYRPKWDRKHSGNGATYGQMTMDSASRRHNGQGYDPKAFGRAKLDEVIEEYRSASGVLLDAGINIIDSATGHGMVKMAMRKIWMLLMDCVNQGQISHGPNGYYIHFGGIVGMCQRLGNLDQGAIKGRMVYMSELGFFGGLRNQDPSDKTSPFVVLVPSDPMQLGIMQVLLLGKALVLKGIRTAPSKSGACKRKQTKRTVRAVLPSLRPVAYRLQQGDATIAELVAQTGLKARAVSRQVNMLVKMGFASKSGPIFSLLVNFESFVSLELEHLPHYRQRVITSIWNTMRWAECSPKRAAIESLAKKRLEALEDGLSVAEVMSHEWSKAA